MSPIYSRLIRLFNTQNTEAVITRQKKALQCRARVCLRISAQGEERLHISVHMSS